MADIISGKSRFLSDNKDKRVYRIEGGEPVDDEQDEDEEIYYKKIKRHKRRKIATGLLGIALVFGIVATISYMIDSVSYTDYIVNYSVNRDDSETTCYTEYKDGYLRYSNDGIAYHNSKGTTVWDKTFSMQKPQVKICGNAVAVGDINGSTI